MAGGLGDRHWRWVYGQCVCSSKTHLGTPSSHISRDLLTPQPSSHLQELTPGGRRQGVWGDRQQDSEEVWCMDSEFDHTQTRLGTPPHLHVEVMVTPHVKENNSKV